MFENRVLMEAFGSQWHKVAEEWRRQHSEELYYLYSSPYTIWVIKSRRMTRRGHVAPMRTGEVHTGFWWKT
jgi:hypothetical protein